MKLTCKSQLIFLLLVTFWSVLTGQNNTAMESETISEGGIGAHIGLMQMIFAVSDGDTRDLSYSSYYSIGLPVGISFPTGGRFVLDLEMVSFIRPHFENPDRDVEVDLLFHPGFLARLGHGFSAGLRAAAELNSDKYGFTPLVNKSFPLKSGNSFFVELLFPGRFDPEKSGKYTQELGIHAGLSF
jgi:hypothetical protein